MRMNLSPLYLPEEDCVEGTSGQKSINLTNYAVLEGFSENRLQKLIFDCPQLLPITALEPNFTEIIPVCRELPTPAGPLDNLFVTPQGNLILVECKLWRNPEARRKVIAQIMDYAKEIASWSYDDLMHAINRANQTNHGNPLYELMKESPDLVQEQMLVDQVSRNLSLGRHLLLIVGDGIQEGAERLTEFLQQNMGLHFTLGLMEMGIYNLPHQKGLIVIPNLIMKTTMIERGVIRFEKGTAQILSPQVDKKLDSTGGRSENLSDIEFFEELTRHNSASAQWLKSYLNKLEDLDVTWEVKQSLLPRFSPDGDHVFSLGYYKNKGQYIVSNVNWGLEKLGMKDLGVEYINNIASIIPDAYIKVSDKGDLKIFIGERVLNITDLMDKDEMLLSITSDFIKKISQTLESH